MKVRANREMTYMSRMLKVGDEFEASPVDARFLLADASVDEVTEREHSFRRSQPRQEPEPASGLADMRREDLLQMAHDRGVALPSGYVTKPDLIEYLEGRKVHEPESEDEDDGA